MYTNNNIETNGVVILKDILSIEESNCIVNWANELEQLKEEKGKWMIYFEDGKKKSRIENFLKYKPELNKFVNTNYRIW